MYTVKGEHSVTDNDVLTVTDNDVLTARIPEDMGKSTMSVAHIFQTLWGEDNAFPALPQALLGFQHYRYPAI